MKCLSSLLHSIAAEHEFFVFLDTAKPDEENKESYLFTNPKSQVIAHTLDEVILAFEEIDRLSNDYYVAGYVGYECGYALHDSECVILRQAQDDTPVLCMGVFDECCVYDCEKEEWNNDCRRADSQICPSPEHKKPDADSNSGMIDSIDFSLSRDQYTQKVEEVLEALRAGESYQVNFTGRYHFEVDIDPITLYLRLRQAQPVAYCALIRLGEHWILSFSPETFFRREGKRIVMQPMKGTAKRGRTFAEDEEQIQWLRLDPKSLAENRMIVDLVRSDLGRICRPGTVQVTAECSVERLPTVLQMTSTVEGELCPDTTWLQIITALFPCGSVTGAPKLRTTEIIQRLETEPRGVYCGAIGFLYGDRGVMNVAIRTVELHQMCESHSWRRWWSQICLLVSGFLVSLNTAKQRNKETKKLTTNYMQTASDFRLATYRGCIGSGGGIVIDSNAESEWKELQLKANFLTEPRPAFELIETLLWNGTTYALLDFHINRLQESAQYFDYVFDVTSIIEQLDQLKAELPKDECKVRLLLDGVGTISLSHQRVDTSHFGTVRLSDQIIDSSNCFYYHKTTHRPLYVQEYAKAQALQCDDTIFYNERGELTEGCISNVILTIDGTDYTPPVSSGLLAGVFRQHLLQTGNIEAKILTIEDLHRATSIWLCNSVRGKWRVTVSN